jgi:hypothetical protein
MNDCPTYDLYIYMYTDICQVALDIIIDDFVRAKLKGIGALTFHKLIEVENNE